MLRYQGAIHIKVAHMQALKIYQISKCNRKRVIPKEYSPSLPHLLHRVPKGQRQQKQYKTEVEESG